MIDMTNNRVPYGLLTDEEKAALHEHEKAGGEFERYAPADLGGWCYTLPEWCDESIYRTVPLPKTQDVIAWEKLPDWVEWVARDENGWVWCYRLEPEVCTGVWSSPSEYHRRIDDFPGILQIGTVYWKDSKQRRPRG
jgi:hypothetical protein